MSHTIHDLFAAYRATSQAERVKGTCFEDPIRTYLRCESAASLPLNTFHSNAYRI